jgi:4-diphosphocytidyl-2-C-methyl-D-erythritol kinase
VPAVLAALAPAKVNLTLRILGRRADGYHDLESLVAFAPFGDRLTLRPGPSLELAVTGPTAGQAGALADNLVLRAARAASERIAGLRLGRFALVKRLPAGAGLGGGSADAAAALRLIAQVNRLAPDDGRIREAAGLTGADVPVCLDPRPRLMRGTGDELSAPLALPRLGLLLVHPGVAVSTAQVFQALRLAPGERRAASAPPGAPGGDAVPGVPRGREAFIAWLAAGANDLEAAAIAIAPAIAPVVDAVAALAGCRLARMSGSGSACFALFDTVRGANAAARRLAETHPHWWARAGTIGERGSPHSLAERQAARGDARGRRDTNFTRRSNTR